MNRLQAGYCKMVNPYGGQVYRVDLTPETVDGFVFWTKNIGPFLKHLPEIEKKGFPFIVQHTINGYPSQLECRVIDYSRTVEHMKRLAGDFGSSLAVWRYDPIIISSITPIDWHRANFAKLAKSLEGTTDEVVISIAQIYKKTKRNMDWASKKFDFNWDAHEKMLEEKIPILRLVEELAQIAKSYSIQLKICSQKDFLTESTQEARCVDADRLERASGKALIRNAKLKGNRKECGCFASRDIGEYDTCPHGCVYCYAVHNRELALSRFKEHEPTSEFLFPPKGYTSSEDEVINNPLIIPIRKIRKESTDSEITQGELF